MKIEEIKTEKDIIYFIEGCLNDFEADVSDKDDTILNIVDLIVFCVNKEKEKHLCSI